MPHKDLEVKRAYHKAYRQRMPAGQKSDLAATQKEWWKSAKGKYSRQKYDSTRRGITWEFTFETWWRVWEDSGKWELRGANTNQYCMCRFGDEGPYSPTNVYIALAADNKRDAFINNKVPTPIGLFYKDLVCV